MSSEILNFNEGFVIISGLTVILSILLFYHLFKRWTHNKPFYFKYKKFLMLFSYLFAIFIIFFLPIIMARIDGNFGELNLYENNPATIQDLNNNLVNPSMSFYLAFLIFLIPVILLFYTLKFRGRHITGIFIFSLLIYLFRNFLFASMYSNNTLGGLFLDLFFPNLLNPAFPIFIRQQIYNSFFLIGVFGFVIFLLLSFCYKLFENTQDNS